MAEVKKSIPGSLKISEDVIASIVKNSVNDTDGVYSILPSPKTIKDLFVKKDDNGAIAISLKDDVVEISLKIIIKSGSKAITVAENVQSNVKSAVQSMTGIAVSRVNVIVADIAFE